MMLAASLVAVCSIASLALAVGAELRNRRMLAELPSYESTEDFVASFGKDLG